MFIFTTRPRKINPQALVAMSYLDDETIWDQQKTYAYLAGRGYAYEAVMVLRMDRPEYESLICDYVQEKKAG